MHARIPRLSDPVKCHSALILVTNGTVDNLCAMYNGNIPENTKDSDRDKGKEPQVNTEKSVTYHVSAMRVTFPNGKVAQKNPERFATISGVFSDPKGNKLSIVSKNVTIEEATNDLTVIDPEAGLLTLPAGQRGRKPVAGVGMSAIEEALKRLRGIEPEEDEDEDSEESESENSEEGEPVTA